MIINNDCLDEMRKMESNSISCIVTDPPYGLGFMGKGWDHEVPGIEYWRECLRVAKPGGYLLAMGGTRKFHRLTSAIEDAGFEIRDCIMWIYGSGFPKSHNKFGCEGYGTALKPAYEPVIMAMKPCDGTFAKNAEKWGQAGINIDACRIPGQTKSFNDLREAKTNDVYGQYKPANYDGSKGRWPANVLFDEEAAKMLDKQSGELKSGSLGKINHPPIDEVYRHGRSIANVNEFKANSGGASRFFYCAKTSSKERNEGLEGMESQSNLRVNAPRESEDAKTATKVKNNHPTVKPLKLMKYLITLIMPPKDGILLDPFAGSGSTILAAHQLGVKAIGIEKSPEYCEIARKRIENWKPEQPDLDLFADQSA